MRLLHETRYETRDREPASAQHTRPPLGDPVTRQSLSSSILKDEALKYKILPSPTKSVSFQDESEERSRVESCGSSPSAAYRSKRDIILARREELAALSKRQAQLFARGRRTIANRLAEKPIFQVSAI